MTMLVKPVTEQRIHRSSTNTFVAVSDATLLVPDRSYSQQYANIYFNRLSKLRPRALASAERKWSTIADQQQAKHVNRVLDIKPGLLCWVAGTVYIDMPMKPNILDEVSHEYGMTVPPPRTKLYSDTADMVMLEDEYGRVQLSGQRLREERMVTGIIIVALGSENSKGEFEVIDICYPGLPPPIESNVDSLQNSETRRGRIALVSGLRIGETQTDPLAIDMMVDYLNGELGLDEDQEDSAKIERVFIIGNTLSVPSPTDVSRKNDFHKKLTALDQADVALARIAATVSVTVLPGITDPTTSSLPQKPMHRSMFPRSSIYPSFTTVTNPFYCDIAGVRVIGTGGQSIDDIYRYVEEEDRLGMAYRTLQWGHLNPTAPDTLWCYPFQDDDPFVLDYRPRLYVVGNQPEFQFGIYREDPKDGSNGSEQQEAKDDNNAVCVVLLPEFHHEACLVVVDLDTLQVTPIYFGEYGTRNEKSQKLKGVCESGETGRAEKMILDEYQGTARSVGLDAFIDNEDDNMDS